MTKKSKFGPFRVLLAAAAAVLALASCDNTYGVFHEIQTETSQVGTDIFKNATVKAIGEDGLNYYAAMAKVYVRAVTGDTWSVLPVSGDSAYYCAGFASDGAGSIYVAAAGTDDATALKGIYSTADSGATWTRLDGGEFAAKVVDTLFYANATLFAAAHTDAETGATFDLYYYDGADFVTAGLVGLDDPVTGLVWDGSSYWAMSLGTLYTGAAPAGFAADATGGPPASGETLRGLAVDSSGNVLITTDEGLLYTYNGAAWTSDVIASGVTLGILAEAPVDASASAYRLLIAKHNSSNGYYEYDASTGDPLAGNDSDAVYVPTASSYTTTIYSKPVMAIYFSAAHDTILIGMAAQGTGTYALYSNTVSGADWSGWTAE